MASLPGILILDLHGNLLYFNYGAFSLLPRLQDLNRQGAASWLAENILGLFHKTRDRLQGKDLPNLQEMDQAFLDDPAGPLRLRCFAVGSALPGADGTHVMIMIEPAAREEDPAQTAAGYRLSRREIEVVRLILQGLSNPAIAAALYVSPQTIKTHVKHIMGKMGVSNRHQIVSKLLGSG